MTGKIHPYYEAIQRIVDAHSDRWAISSLAAEAKIDPSTIRKAIEAGSAPSITTVEKLQKVLGLDYDGVINWSGEPLDDLQKEKELLELRDHARRMNKDDRARLLDLARRLDPLSPEPPPEVSGDDEG